MKTTEFFAVYLKDGQKKIVRIGDTAGIDNRQVAQWLHDQLGLLTNDKQYAPTNIKDVRLTTRASCHISISGIEVID
jgi:hypothetical protein